MNIKPLTWTDTHNYYITIIIMIVMIITIVIYKILAVVLILLLPLLFSMFYNPTKLRSPNLAHQISNICLQEIGQAVSYCHPIYPMYMQCR